MRRFNVYSKHHIERVHSVTYCGLQQCPMFDDFDFSTFSNCEALRVEEFWTELQCKWLLLPLDRGCLASVDDRRVILTLGVQLLL